jgi:hypothetical protein
MKLWLFWGQPVFKGHANKLTLNYQNRPVYQANTIGELKSMIEKRKIVISNRNKLNNNYYGKLYF